MWKRLIRRISPKIAITAHRIKNISSTHTTFDYKDYADGNKKKEMILTNEEFLRRFEQHPERSEIMNTYKNKL